MRILLQNTETKLYLGRGGIWTNHPEAALAFLDEVRAKDYSIYHRLAQAQVVVQAPLDASGSCPPAASATERWPASAQPPLSITINKPNQTNTYAEMKPTAHNATNQLPSASQMAKLPGEKPARKPRLAKPRAQAAAPPEQTTLVQARIDVGLGNSLFIRGQGDGLSWDKGLPLTCTDGVTWIWSTARAKDKLVFKLLLNDRVWSKGDDIVVEAGRKIEISPAF